MTGSRSAAPAGRFPLHGWLGVGLVSVFWPLNWSLEGLRTHWCFFPLWLGYCLAVDGISVRRRGTSLLTRSPRLYLGLFLISAPLWWVFEAINLRTRNWHYVGRELFGNLEYGLLASLSFSTVVPAVLGTAELAAGLPIARRCRRGPILRPNRRTPFRFLVAGLAMFLLMIAWPLYFFPLVWLSPYFVLEAVNLRIGNRSLLERTRKGDWSPVVALWLGVLICAFFWEMWNVFSYPKWTYTVPWIGVWHVFEMPLPGYLGYLPFSLEVFAAVHLILGLAGMGRTSYVVEGLLRNVRPVSGPGVGRTDGMS